MFSTESEIRVRFVETDQMGVAHHSNYLHWFEVARTDFLRQLGFSYRELEERGVSMPVLEVGLRYLKPSLYDDLVKIKTTLAERSKLKLRFHYEIFSEKGEKRTTGFTVLGILNKAGKPQVLPEDVDAVLSRVVVGL